MMARYDKAMATLLTAEIASGGFDQPVSPSGQMSDTERIDKFDENARNIFKDKDSDNALSEEQQKAQKELIEENLFPQTSQQAVSQYNVGLAKAIGGIHRNFLDDSGIEPLIDACLVSFSKVKSDFKTRSDVRKLARLEQMLGDLLWLDELAWLIRMKENAEDANFSISQYERERLSYFDIFTTDEGKVNGNKIEDEIISLSDYLLTKVTGNSLQFTKFGELSEGILKFLEEEGLITSSDRESVKDARLQIADLYKDTLVQL